MKKLLTPTPVIEIPIGVRYLPGLKRKTKGLGVIIEDNDRMVIPYPYSIYTSSTWYPHLTFLTDLGKIG